LAAVFLRTVWMGEGTALAGTGLAAKRRVLPLAPIPVAQPLRPSGRFLTIHAMGRRPEICAFFIR
jgi:hypothetical protein